MESSDSRRSGLSVIALATFTFMLYELPQTPPPETFACPMVPAIPLLGILSNCYMMGSMEADTWGLIAAWLLIGLCFYGFYGIHNSNLRVKVNDYNPTAIGLAESHNPTAIGLAESESRDLLPSKGLNPEGSVRSYDSTKL